MATKHFPVQPQKLNLIKLAFLEFSLVFFPSQCTKGNWLLDNSKPYHHMRMKWMLDEIFRVLQTKSGFALDREPGINDATQWNLHPLVTKNLSKTCIIWLFDECSSVFLLNSSIKQPCDQKRNLEQKNTLKLRIKNKLKNANCCIFKICLDWSLEKLEGIFRC